MDNKLWDIYSQALRREDALLIEVRNTEAQLSSARIRLEKAKARTQDIEAVMRGVACGYPLEVMLANLGLNADFVMADV